jgi:hypothetical protein
MGHLGNWVAPDVEQQLLEFLDFSFPQIGAADCAMKALSADIFAECFIVP